MCWLVYVLLRVSCRAQSYVQAVTGGGPGMGVGVGGASGGMGMGVGVGVPGYMALPRARAHTPLRHAHVTSTTHPHHLHGTRTQLLWGRDTLRALPKFLMYRCSGFFCYLHFLFLKM